MINRYRKVTLRIFGRNGAYTDSETDALCTQEERKRGNGFGGEGNAVYIILPGTEVMPGAGDIITDGDRKREITEVKICRDLAGEVRAVKCITLN